MHLGPLCFSLGNFFGNLEVVHLLVQKNFDSHCLAPKNTDDNDVPVKCHFGTLQFKTSRIELLSFWHQDGYCHFLASSNVNSWTAKKLAKFWLGHPEWQWVDLLFWNASLVCFYGTNTWTPRALAAIHVANNGYINTQIFYFLFCLKSMYKLRLAFFWTLNPNSNEHPIHK